MDKRTNPNPIEFSRDRETGRRLAGRGLTWALAAIVATGAAGYLVKNEMDKDENLAASSACFSETINAKLQPFAEELTGVGKPEIKIRDERTGKFFGVTPEEARRAGLLKTTDEKNYRYYDPALSLAEVDVFSETSIKPGVVAAMQGLLRGDVQDTDHLRTAMEKLKAALEIRYPDGTTLLVGQSVRAGGKPGDFHAFEYGKGYIRDIEKDKPGVSEIGLEARRRFEEAFKGAQSTCKL